MTGHMEEFLFECGIKKLGQPYASKNSGENFLVQRVANFGPQAKSRIWMTDFYVFKLLCFKWSYK